MTPDRNVKKEEHGISGDQKSPSSVRTMVKLFDQKSGADAASLVSSEIFSGVPTSSVKSYCCVDEMEKEIGGNTRQLKIPAELAMLGMVIKNVHGCWERGNTLQQPKTLVDIEERRQMWIGVGKKMRKFFRRDYTENELVDLKNQLYSNTRIASSYLRPFAYYMHEPRVPVTLKAATQCDFVDVAVDMTPTLFPSPAREYTTLPILLALESEQKTSVFGVNLVVSYQGDVPPKFTPDVIGVGDMVVWNRTGSDVGSCQRTRYPIMVNPLDGNGESVTNFRTGNGFRIQVVMFRNYEFVLSPTRDSVDDYFYKSGMSPKYMSHHSMHLRGMLGEKSLNIDSNFFITHQSLPVSEMKPSAVFVNGAEYPCCAEEDNAERKREVVQPTHKPRNH